MSLDTYFLKQSTNMPQRNTKNSSKSETEHNREGEDNATVSSDASISVSEPGPRQIIKEVTENISKLIDEKLSPLSQLLQQQNEKLDDHEKRITETENRISAVEDAAAPVEGKLETLAKRVRELTEHVDDLENRGRRKNIRIVGLPENAEGDRPVNFFESWLPNSLGIQTKSGRMKIERAHRVPGRALKTASPYPRAVLVRFHNYVDKERVITAARELGNGEKALMFGNSKVKIFQDFSAAVLRKRKQFDEVKKRLKAAGATYAQLYPASLKVTYRGATNVFQDPIEVDKFLSSQEGISL